MGKSDSYKGKKLAMEIAFEWAQMLDSAEKFKTVNLSIFKELKETIFKELKKDIMKTSYRMENMN